MVDFSRRGWLQGSTESAAPLRPPGAGSEAVFSSLCSRCELCLPACPQQLLYRGQGGFPQLDPRRGGCDFCGRCAEVCTASALDPQRWPWLWRIALHGTCLSQQGTVCRSCGEHCERGALAFRLAVGGVALLEIDPSRCNGCGDCVGACPTSALQLQNIETKKVRHANAHR